jgi:hypothetical protein
MSRLSGIFKVRHRKKVVGIEEDIRRLRSVVKE